MVTNQSHANKKLTIVAALDDVPRLAGDHVAGKAGHEDFDELEITALPFKWCLKVI
jgi:hypothetical protein